LLLILNDSWLTKQGRHFKCSKDKTLHTERVTDLDLRSKMISFGSILTTFELSSIFGGSWASIQNWLEPKTQPPSGNLALPTP